MKVQQTVGVIFVLAILVEFMETREVFKFEKPHKYHRLRPNKFRQRTRYTRRPSAYRTWKENLSRHQHYGHRGQPSDTWQESYYAGGHVKSEPYAIEIKLPKHHESRPWTRDPVNHNYGYKPAQDSYNDENETLMQTIVNGIQIKLVKGPQPKLQIKLSRSDNEAQIRNAPS